MFEHTLQSIPPRVAVDASYLTIRFIKHRAEHPKDYIVLDMPSEPGPEAQAAALELVQEIERIEGTTVSALDGGSADSYIGRLASFISERVKDDVGTDRSRGQLLLDYLRGAFPPETSLLEGNLQGGDLRRANLRGADLRGANLRGADLRGADLGEANLTEADLRGAYLQRADLVGAYLEEADLHGAYLQSADLSDAFLQRANLLRAYLQESHLQRADLVGAYLREARLHEADLRGADLLRADIVGAYLHRADLEGAMHLTQEQLEQAVGDENTTIPEGLIRPAAWWGGSAGVYIF